MKTAKGISIIMFSFSSLFISCTDNDCKSGDPIFNSSSPNSTEYKTKLAERISIVDKSKLRYWFKEYKIEAGKERLYFNIQGENICAILALDVENWNKLEELRQKQGKSFSGAEFKGLSFTVRKDSTNINFIYNDYDKIID